MRYALMTLLAGMTACAPTGDENDAVPENATRMTQAEAAKVFVTVGGKQMPITEYAPGARYYLGEHLDLPKLSLTVDPTSSSATSAPPPPTIPCSESMTYDNAPDPHTAYLCYLGTCSPMDVIEYAHVSCFDTCGGPEFTCTVTSGCLWAPHAIDQPTAVPKSSCYRFACNQLNLCTGPC